MSWPFAAASALLTIVWGWFLLAPNLYSLEAMFFALVALACFLRAKQISRTWLFLAGVACGAAMMIKQNTGVYAAIGLSLSLWISAAARTRRRSVRRCENGGAQTKIRSSRASRSSSFRRSLYLIAIGAGPHLYENWVYYPLQLYPRGLTFEYPSFYPLGDDVWQKLVLYLPVAGLSVCGSGSCGLRACAKVSGASADGAFEAHGLLAVTLFGALTFLQAFPRADMTHILFGMQPAFILLGYLCFTLLAARLRFSNVTALRHARHRAVPVAAGCLDSQKAIT